MKKFLKKFFFSSFFMIICMVVLRTQELQLPQSNFLPTLNKTQIYKNETLLKAYPYQSLDLADCTYGVSIRLNGSVLNFDGEPFIVKDTTFIPIRVISENLGGIVSWNPVPQEIVVLHNGKKLVLTANSDSAYIDSTEYKLPYPPTIVNGRTYVPLRFVSEALGAKIDWYSATKCVSITSIDSLLMPETFENFNFRGISVGDSLDKVVQTMGQPQRIDPSEFLFKWYIYNTEYKDYCQIGILEGIVVALYTNSLGLSSPKGVNIGTQKSAVRELYGEPLTYLDKKEMRYILSKTDEQDVFSFDNCYNTLFYDVKDGYKLTALLQVQQSVEMTSGSFYGQGSLDLAQCYEKEIFDLANSIRKRMGKNIFNWDETAKLVAESHSKDMAVNAYFDHKNLSGLSPFDRMKNGGIRFSSAAENIAAGQRNAIYAHEAWLNSTGHRINLLGNYEKLGVGVYFGGGYSVYFTQNFYTSF